MSKILYKMITNCLTNHKSANILHTKMKYLVSTFTQTALYGSNLTLKKMGNFIDKYWDSIIKIYYYWFFPPYISQNILIIDIPDYNLSHKKLFTVLPLSSFSSSSFSSSYHLSDQVCSLESWLYWLFWLCQTGQNVSK